MTLTQQVNHLFLSCGMGFLLGLYYDVFRVIRLVMRSGKRWIVVQDLLFFLSSAVITFLFALAVMDGQLRFYLFLGEGIGFAAYYWTIGRLMMRFAGVVTALIVRVWNGFWRLVSLPFRWAVCLFRRPARAAALFLQKIKGKAAELLKKGLKRAKGVLYNQKKQPPKPRAAIERKRNEP